MASLSRDAVFSTDEVGSSQPLLQSMDVDLSQLQQSLTNSRLEQDYEKTHRQTQNILHDEAARVLRVRIMLLEHENDILQEQLDEADYRVEDLENAEADAKDNLVQAENDLQRAQHDLRLRCREVETLKVRCNCRRVCVSLIVIVG